MSRYSDDPTIRSHREWGEEGEVDERAKPRPRRRRNFFSERQPSSWEPKDYIDRIAVLWIETGTEKLGERPPVNAEKFAQRLRKVVDSDVQMQRCLRGEAKPPTWHEWQRGEVFVKHWLEHMVRVYWTDVDDVPTSTMQWQFLRDFWEPLKEHGKFGTEIDAVRAAGFKVKEKPVYTPYHEQTYQATQRKRRIEAWIDSCLEECERLRDEPEETQEEKDRKDRLLREWRDRVERQREDTTDD